MLALNAHSGSFLDYLAYGYFNRKEKSSGSTNWARAVSLCCVKLGLSGALLVIGVAHLHKSRILLNIKTESRV